MGRPEWVTLGCGGRAVLIRPGGPEPDVAVGRVPTPVVHAERVEPARIVPRLARRAELNVLLTDDQGVRHAPLHVARLQGGCGAGARGAAGDDHPVPAR